jgi:hypothetical protein
MGCNAIRYLPSCIGRVNIGFFSFHIIKKDKKMKKLQRGLVIINDHQFLSDLLGGLLKDQGFEWIKFFTTPTWVALHSFYSKLYADQAVM